MRLRTDRLQFCEWRESDFELALQLWGDADVTRLIGGPFSREQVAERLAREVASPVQYWPMFLRENGDFVGCCGLRPYAGDGVFEFGVHLRSAFQRHGFAREASRAVIDYAFEVVRVTALFAGHHPNNTRSKALLEKLGFIYTHDEYYAPTGLHHPSYRLTRL